jgi:hypothetical protein
MKEHTNEALRPTAPSGGVAMRLLRRLKERMTNRYAADSVALSDSDRSSIESMVSAVAAGKEITQPSLYWQTLVRLNIDQLSYTGYENFKRTLALNYFTFVNILPWDPQARVLAKGIPTSRLIRIVIARSRPNRCSSTRRVNWIQTRIYCFQKAAP